MKRLLIGVAIIIGAVCVVAAVVLGPYVVRVQRFRASPTAGFHADFYLYVPSGALDGGGPATILVQPNNSGINSDDPDVHRDDAWWTGFGRHWIADELGVVLLVPAFVRPAEDWRIYTHALDRDTLTTKRDDLRRIDLQLIAMIDAARASLAEGGAKVDEKVLIQGFSASGMFANRFTALHPERVKAAAFGSPGGWPIAPATTVGTDPLPYPLGVSDLEELVGRDFDQSAFASVPQLVVMGSLDDNDSLDFRDGYSEDQAALADRLFGSDPRSRWDDSQRLYGAIGAQAKFLLVEGVGHDRKKLQPHTTEFFARILGR